MQAPIPVLRMFDEALTKDFYLGFLGFSLDWEHRFSDDAPLYAQVSRGGCVLNLSGHFGDGTPGTVVRIGMEEGELHGYLQELRDQHYRHSRPGEPELQPWGLLEITLTDPSGNQLRLYAEASHAGGGGRGSDAIAGEILELVTPVFWQPGNEKPVEIRCSIDGTASGIPANFVDAVDRAAAEAAAEAAAGETSGTGWPYRPDASQPSASERLHELLAEFARLHAVENGGEVPHSVIIRHGGGMFGHIDIWAEE